MDEELRRLEEQADRQARRLARTVAELARVRAEAAWAGLTPEQRRARIREQARRAGPAAAIMAFATVCWAAVRRPEVALAAMTGAVVVGLGPSAGLGPAPEPPDRPPVTAPTPPDTAPMPAPRRGPTPTPAPAPEPPAGSTVPVAQPDDVPEPPTLPVALPSPGPPELTPAPTPTPSPPPEPRPEPPPEALPPDHCLGLDLKLINLTLCAPTLDPRS